jgi:large subunit ribosomal protein L30
VIIMVEITKPMPKLRKETPKAEPKAEAPKAESKAPKAAKASGDKIAAVLIRGREIGIRHDVKQALDILKLQRRQICVVYNDNPSIRGLLFKCKDLITYGPISEETYKLLNEKRGSLKNREGKALDVFRMHPPRGGYGRKGIKVSYQEGGCLGLRRKGMDEFLAKMM